MKIYKPELTKQEFDDIANIFNVAVKASGLVGNIDVKARQILVKINKSEVEENNLPELAVNGKEVPSYAKASEDKLEKV